MGRVTRSVVEARLLMLLTVLALTTSAGGLPGRAVFVVLFCLLVPGWCIAATSGLRSAALTWPVAAAISIAVGTLVGQAMVLTGSWHPEAAGQLLAAACLVSLARQSGLGPARLGLRRRRSGGSP